MQSVRSRIWTRVAVSISCDDNHYTTGTSRVCVYSCIHTVDRLLWFCLISDLSLWISYWTSLSMKTFELCKCFFYMLVCVCIHSLIDTLIHAYFQGFWVDFCFVFVFFPVSFSLCMYVHLWIHIFFQGHPLSLMSIRMYLCICLYMIRLSLMLV